MANAVTISLLGYTNPPGTTIRFALFTVSNQAPYSIRRRDDWVEMEGNPQHLAEIFNFSLPNPAGMNPVLKSGGSFVLAIGEPREWNENDHWRFSMSYVPETFGQKWLAYSFRHNLPLKIGPVALLDSRKLLAPSNNISVAGPWLGK